MACSPKKHRISTTVDGIPTSESKQRCCVAVVSKRVPEAALEAKYPGCVVVDVTSRGPEPFAWLSPFTAHCGIPVPGTDMVSDSVEGAWQGLKLDSETEQLDLSRLHGVGRKRKCRPSCHQLGVSGEKLDYLEARRRLYMPMYEWTLVNSPRAVVAVKELRKLMDTHTVLLLRDYDTNCDPDVAKPLSHASLVATHLQKTT